jgi:hypothetical protein
MAKKKSVKKAGGAALPVMLDCMDAYVRDYAPSLLPVYMTLMPFGYLFGSMCASPQKKAKDYDPDKPPSLRIQIDDPRYPGGDTDGVSLECVITADKITMHWYCMNGANGEDYHEKSEITLSGLWDYLRQIPKPYECFCKGGE